MQVSKRKREIDCNSCGETFTGLLVRDDNVYVEGDCPSCGTNVKFEH